MSIIIYPAYFNPHYSRRQGRRVPKSLAFEAKVDTISRALKALNYDFEVEEDKRYPRFWWQERGRIIVNTDEKKSELIMKIARKVRNV